jgi:uncharacterized protein (TIGR02448 family)
MKKLVLSVLMLTSVSAFAGSFEKAAGNMSLVTISPVLSSVTSRDCGFELSRCFDKQILENAKDDAAAFVGSEGRIRGPNLQSALDLVRRYNPAAQASDIQIANEILGLE